MGSPAAGWAGMAALLVGGLAQVFGRFGSRLGRGLGRGLQPLSFLTPL